MSEPHSSVLPRAVALQVAELARVPLEERDQFCDLVYGTMQTAWDWHRSALPTGPGQSLVDAADAARILHKQLGKLKEADRLWVERLVTQTIPDRTRASGSNNFRAAGSIFRGTTEGFAGCN